MTDTVPRPVGRPKLPPRVNVSTMTVRDVPVAYKTAMALLMPCSLTAQDAEGGIAMIFNGRSTNRVALDLFEAGLRYITPVIEKEIEIATRDVDGLNAIVSVFLADKTVKSVHARDFEEGSAAHYWIEDQELLTSQVNEGLPEEEEKYVFDGISRKEAMDNLAEATGTLEGLEAAAEAVATALAPVAE